MAYVITAVVAFVMGAVSMKLWGAKVLADAYAEIEYLKNKIK